MNTRTNPVGRVPPRGTNVNRSPDAAVGRVPSHGATDYGEALLERFTANFGRGFGRPNLIRLCQFFQAFPTLGIRFTGSAKSELRKVQTLFGQSPLEHLQAAVKAFPLVWSHLLRIEHSVGRVILMSLETTIADITKRLREGRFPNEQAISQGVVLRILQELGWDTWDTNLVWPEYQTGEGRADFALCHPATKPALFIEVKPPGRAEDAVRQALDYAFHSGGVPIVILTDGKTWSFYLTMEQGSYEERRVYKLDLFEREAQEAAATLQKYLQQARVVSGEALECARTEYRSRNRRAQAQAAIPEAWKELIAKGDELLVELIADAVESKAGIRPDDDDVTDFLASLGKTPILQPPQTQPTARPTTPPPMLRTPPPPEPGASTRAGTLVLRGKAYGYTNAKEAMVKVLTELANEDSTFLQRCSQHPDAQGTRRRYIAQTPEELYPNRPDLREHREPLPQGWFVATNLNNPLKKAIIRLAAEVAGLKFGTDLKVDF